MATQTTNYNLTKPTPSDEYDIAVHNANMDAIDLALTPTADPSQIPAGLTGKLPQWMSWITNRIKAITGKTNWYDAPDLTLAAAATASEVSTTSSAGLANTISRGDHVHNLPAVTTTANTSSSSPNDGTSVTMIDSITTDGYGRATAKNTKTVTLPAILTKVLTGLSTATNTAITATDTILSAFGKLQAQITTHTHTAAQVLIADSGNNFAATEVEGALTELFTSVSSGKNSLATDITTKGGIVTKVGTYPTFSELHNGIVSITSNKRFGRMKSKGQFSDFELCMCGGMGDTTYTRAFINQ